MLSRLPASRKKMSFFQKEKLPTHRHTDTHTVALLCVCITWKTSRQTTHRKLYVCLSPGKKIKIKIKFSISTQKSHFLKIIGQKYTPPIETTPDKTHVLRKLCVCRRKKKKNTCFLDCFFLQAKTMHVFPCVAKPDVSGRHTHAHTHTHGGRWSSFSTYAPPEMPILSSQNRVYLQAENALFPSQKSLPLKLFINLQKSLSPRKLR